MATGLDLQLGRAPHWYWQWSPELFIAIVFILGTIYYYTVQVHKSQDVLEEHRAGIDMNNLPPMPRGDAAP